MSAIVVESVSKRYEIGRRPEHDTLRDTLSHGAKNLWSRLRRRTTGAAGEDDFWALRDVSFTVEPGEVVGIIGRNGAGKSTLLKILSRITEPTLGRVRLRGRVASLLEVGTGFHPELTGRENIFLNGAILGMSRSEIRRKFDEIIAFAEVDRFLDTPVKRYSSGMYVRLAFAIAAHLEPEILIVDEVLAVGDLEFQKKCVGKMKQVAGGGRTVLFVSHNLAAVQNLCTSAIWLRQGRIAQQSAVRDCIAAYSSEGNRSAAFATTTGSKPRITSVRVNDLALADGALEVEVGFASPFAFAPVVGVILYTKFGQPISGGNGRMAGEHWRPIPTNNGTITARIAALPLHSDTYRVSVWLGDAAMDYDEKRDVAEFDFVARDFRPRAPSTDVIGPIDLPWQWSLSTK